MPPPRSSHMLHACGLVANLDGEMEMVVVGGMDTSTVEIFSFHRVEWRYEKNQIVLAIVYVLSLIHI